MSHRENFEAETEKMAVVAAIQGRNVYHPEYVECLESLQPPLYELVDCPECGGEPYSGCEGDIKCEDNDAIESCKGCRYECQRCFGEGKIKRPLYYPPEAYERMGFELRDDTPVWVEWKTWLNGNQDGQGWDLAEYYQCSPKKANVYIAFPNQPKPTGEEGTAWRVEK